jgi:hypothetical protein
MENKHIKKIYACDCWSEAVEIEKNEEGNIEMCFWQCGLHPHNTSFKEKLRKAWYILTHNNFWSDECILTKETARQLGEDLIELSN